MIWPSVALGALLAAAVATLPADAVSPRAIPIPTRPLEWKDVNFITTSDIHGWLLGHQHATWPEPNYSGDFGDLASFVTHLRAEADRRGVDVLVIDQGDHHDGSGLVSSSPTGAALTDNIIAMLDYDVLAIGNHELYKYGTAREVYDSVGQWNGRFLTSNTNITIGKDTMPIGERYLKFKTKQGRKVTALGILFNFRVTDKGITVQPPELLVKEPWFQEVISDQPSFFVIAGHMPVRGEDADFQMVLDAIRDKHPTTPVFIFGGHTHIRDCVQLDDFSMSLEPGRYMETIGWMSSSLPDTDAKLDMSRRYINANRPSYKFHTKTGSSFDTSLGVKISTRLDELATSLNVSTPIGTSPKDLFLSRHEFEHPSSVLTAFAKEVLPATVIDSSRQGPRIIIANSGSQRFDLFKGTFNRNDELTVSPFKSTFLVISLPVWIARNVTDQLNRQGSSQLKCDSVETAFGDWQHAQWLEETSRASTAAQAPLLPHRGRTLGYVTKDACPGIGDDVEHIAIPHTWNIPEFISSDLPNVDSDKIDVVFMDFFIGDFVRAVHALDPTSTVAVSDAQEYAVGLDASAVWGLYAAKHW